MTTSPQVQALQHMVHAWEQYGQAHQPPVAVLTHLWAWQLITQARLQAALTNTQPVYPLWPTVDPDAEDDKDTTNDWIQRTHGGVGADVAYARWRAGFDAVIALASCVPDTRWEDPSYVPWLHGYLLIDVIFGTLEHHREHLAEVMG